MGSSPRAPRTSTTVQARGATPERPAGSPPRLNVLMVEDSPFDAELLIEQLKAQGFDFVNTLVDSEARFLEHLDPSVDVILTDYAVPGFDILKLPRLLRERRLDVPIIMVSGTVGEERAVEALREGVTDYVLKNRPQRLGQAIERALEARALRERSRIAEEALRESEQRYRAMFEENPHPMWVFDIETLQFLAVNDAAIGHYGYSREEFLRMSIRDIRPAGEHDRLTRGLRDAGNPGFILSGEFKHRRKDGTIIHVRVESHGLRFKGRVARVVLATDISEQKRAESALSTSETQKRDILKQNRLLALALESTNEMVSVTDLQDRFTYVNSAFLRTYGYTADEVLGRTPAMLRPSDVPQQLVRSIHDETYRGGWQGEVVNQRKDGSRLVVGLNTSVIRNEDGEMIGLLGVARDITERKKSEAAQRATEARTQFALKGAGIGIWEWDAQTGAMKWSETLEQIHGLEPGAFAGTIDAFLLMIHAEDREAVQKALNRAVEQRADAGFEYRAVWPDGSTHWFIGKGRFSRDLEGTLIGGVGIGIDVTDRKLLETQLLQSQKIDAIGRLAGGVAHDFNNLLTAILGYTELLTPAVEGQPRHCKDLDQIRKAAMRATRLTGQLLAFSRKQILQPVVVDLNTLVDEVASLLRRLIGEDIELAIRLDRKLGRIKADPGQIEQVIMNLAVNARDAMVSGGRLLIETANVDLDDQFFRRLGMTNETGEHRFVMLSVTDTGHGMGTETRKRIFEPFFTTKPKGKGTGLGLATVYGIVKQSGGSIWVYSEPGQGTTFKIYLPRTDQPLTIDVAPTIDLRMEGTETVLLVEDEDAVRLLSRTLLERRGYRVIEAPDAEQALELAAAETEPIDLLVTDVVMPGRTGPELFEVLKPIRPMMKVLYVSGYTDETIVQRGVLAAGTPFLQKPFTALNLSLKVREVLDSQ